MSFIVFACLFLPLQYDDRYAAHNYYASHSESLPSMLNCIVHIAHDGFSAYSTSSLSSASEFDNPLSACPGSRVIHVPANCTCLSSGISNSTRPLLKNRQLDVLSHQFLNRWLDPGLVMVTVFTEPHDDMNLILALLLCVSDRRLGLLDGYLSRAFIGSLPVPNKLPTFCHRKDRVNQS